MYIVYSKGCRKQGGILDFVFWVAVHKELSAVDRDALQELKVSDCIVLLTGFAHFKNDGLWDDGFSDIRFCLGVLLFLDLLGFEEGKLLG